jgi:hypothetical protein
LSSRHLNNLNIPGYAAFPFSGNHEVAPFTQTLNYSAAHVLFPACKTQDGLSPIFLVSAIQAAACLLPAVFLFRRERQECNIPRSLN